MRVTLGSLLSSLKFLLHAEHNIKCEPVNVWDSGLCFDLQESFEYDSLQPRQQLTFDFCRGNEEITGRHS